VELVFCLLLAEVDPPGFDRAIARWHARFVLTASGITADEAALALTAAKGLCGLKTRELAARTLRQLASARRLIARLAGKMVVRGCPAGDGGGLNWPGYSQHVEKKGRACGAYTAGSRSRRFSRCFSADLTVAATSARAGTLRGSTRVWRQKRASRSLVGSKTTLPFAGVRRTL
jgi:hypothetical protein